MLRIQMPLAAVRLVPFDCLYAIFNHRSTTGGCTGRAGHGLGVSQASCSDYGCHMLSYRVSHPRKGTAWKESQRETKRKRANETNNPRYPHGPKPTHTHTHTAQCNCVTVMGGSVVQSSEAPTSVSCAVAWMLVINIYLQLAIANNARKGS